MRGVFCWVDGLGFKNGVTLGLELELRFRGGKWRRNKMVGLLGNEAVV